MGTGSAGYVLANKLREVKNWKVVVLNVNYYSTEDTYINLSF